MNGSKRIVLALGIGVLFALGIVAVTQAQQPANTGTSPTVDEKGLRDEIVRLRTDVELLQIKHEAARGHLAEVLQRQHRLEFLEAADVLQPVALYGYQVAAVTGDKADADALGKVVARLDSLDEKARRELDDAAKQDIKRTRDGFGAAVDRETQKFGEITRALHEKSMALAAAETRYAGFK